MSQNIYDNEHFYKGYTKIRNNKLSYNEIIEMPVMKAELPNIEGKMVLDIGCGMGKFIQYMLDMNPKQIVGLDISNNMISYAKDNINDERVSFVVSDILSFETETKFDVIVSSLAFHYVEDYEALILKLNGMLIRGGVLLFSTEHPLTTATKQQENWCHVESRHNHYKLDHYFEESARPIEWIETEVIRYHRTIGTLINTLIENEFQIERVIDTGNTEISLKLWDEEDIMKVNHRPPFIVIKAKKQ
ncbi:class I SAM-dependent methyltransferase [Macrococcus sp. EM39E]|uniref:class I SAM-dependent methyltransferase n=1 Tax=Macrococcus animalis TaxID=3395467 RepID=UPI0039BE49B0